jgi:hypothetical protein
MEVMFTVLAPDWVGLFVSPDHCYQMVKVSVIAIIYSEYMSKYSYISSDHVAFRYDFHS